MPEKTMSSTASIYWPYIGSYILLICILFLRFELNGEKKVKAIVLFIGIQNYGKSSYDYYAQLIVFVCETASYDDMA